MRILQGNLCLTRRELAEMLGMSLDGLSYFLNALIDMGFPEMNNFHLSKGKFRYVYLLTSLAIAEKVTYTSRSLRRKMEEYEALKTEIEALKLEVSKTDLYGVREV